MSVNAEFDRPWCTGTGNLTAGAATLADLGAMWGIAWEDTGAWGYNNGTRAAMGGR